MVSHQVHQEPVLHVKTFFPTFKMHCNGVKPCDALIFWHFLWLKIYFYLSLVCLMGWFCYLCERWHTFWCFSVIFTSLCQYMCFWLAWHTFYCIFWKMRLWVLFITGVSWLYLLIKFNQTFLFCFWNGWILFINYWIHVFIEFIKPVHTPKWSLEKHKDVIGFPTI